MSSPTAQDRSSQQPPVLSISNLCVSFFPERGELPIIRNFELEIAAGETVALVGESGCGKSLTALSIMGLLDAPGRIVDGSIRLHGQELVGLDTKSYQRLRGKRMGMIFQEPMTSLNPVFSIGRQIREVLVCHLQMTDTQAQARAIELLHKVGIPSPERRVEQYPHELSGGMKQRAMIAMALACNPELLIADEPTTALDVTIQAQIIELLAELQSELGMAILLITHNLGVVAHFAKRVTVMYAGMIAERAGVKALFGAPRHPYTVALLQSLPNPANPASRLSAIAGSVPAAHEFPSGCRFSTRCPKAMDHCRGAMPRLTRGESGHEVACWLYDEKVAEPMAHGGEQA